MMAFNCSSPSPVSTFSPLFLSLLAFNCPSSSPSHLPFRFFLPLSVNKYYDLITEMSKALFRLAQRNNWDPENVEMVTSVLGQGAFRIVDLADVCLPDCSPIGILSLSSFSIIFVYHMSL